MAKAKGPTQTCPECGGDGVKQVRYTDPPTPCPTCGGDGNVPADEGAEAAEAVEAEAVAPKPEEPAA